MSAKKYKLFSAGDGDGPRPCAFFASEAGCKNGAACRFSHGGAAPPAPRTPAAAIATNSSSSVVSSESEGGGYGGNTAPPPAVFAPPPARVVVQPEAVAAAAASSANAEGSASGKKKKKAKRKKQPEQPTAAVDSDNIFANPKPANASNKKPKQQKQPKQQNAASASPAPTAAPPNTNNSPFQPPSQNAQQQPPQQQQQQQQQQPPKKKAKRSAAATPTPTPQASKKAATTPSFRDLDLPLAPFSIPDADDDPPQHRPATPSETPPHAHPAPLPLPKSTPAGRRWCEAVLATRSHDRYDNSYDFDRYKEFDRAAFRGSTGESWVKAKPYGKWCSTNPQAIAIDCEMCETRDPVTGKTDSKALCRISIVDATDSDPDNHEVLLDTLVKPTWPVVDYRSRINGIKKEHLDGVQFTLRHAQAYLMALCSDETVIMGHALHNDLVALRMEHDCNVDSACLYSVKDEPGATASLRDLAMAVLGKPMPETHDSVNDARTAQRCLQNYVDKGGKVDPIVRSYPRKNRGSTGGGGGGGGGNTLLVHRIPRMCLPTHLHQMFLAHTSVQPNEVGPIEFNNSTGKVNVTFPSHDHARLAFDALSGEEKPDKTGLLQKKVYLRNGDYVQVRKMIKNKQQDAAAAAVAAPN